MDSRLIEQPTSGLSPRISQGSGAPITSVGTGSNQMLSPTFSEASTSSPFSTAGPLIGGLMGAILANRDAAKALAAERAGSSGKSVVKSAGSAAARAAARVAAAEAKKLLFNTVAEKQAAPATAEELEAERKYGYIGTHGPQFDQATPEELAAEREYGYTGTQGAAPDYNYGTYQDSEGNVWNNGKLVYDASTSNYYSGGDWFNQGGEKYSSPMFGGVDFENPSSPSFSGDYGFDYPSVTGPSTYDFSSSSGFNQPSSSFLGDVDFSSPSSSFDSGFSFDDGKSYDFGFKDGGNVTMMKDGGVPHMADGGLMDILAQYLPPGVMDYINAAGGNIGGTVLGAGAGAALGKLLSGMTQNTGGVNQGVDMSKVGVIAPHTTSFGMGPAKYIGYDQYGSQGGSDVYANTDLYRDLSTPMNAPQGGLSSVPKMASGRAVHFTYGTPVDPMQIMQDEQPMQGLRDGGTPEALGHPEMAAGRRDFRQGSYVDGPGDGQSDDIPAMLADGEYVFDSDTVAALGNGSSKAGAKALDKMRESIRAHKRSAPVNKIPPPAKSPLAYLKGMK